MSRYIGRIRRWIIRNTEYNWKGKFAMLVLGLNKICKWCHVLSNGRKYTCQTKEIGGKLFFYFKKEWHSVADYISANASELVEEGGKVFSRRLRL